MLYLNEVFQCLVQVFVSALQHELVNVLKISPYCSTAAGNLYDAGCTTSCLVTDCILPLNAVCFTALFSDDCPSQRYLQVEEMPSRSANSIEEKRPSEFLPPLLKFMKPVKLYGKCHFIPMAGQKVVDDTVLFFCFSQKRTGQSSLNISNIYLI